MPQNPEQKKSNLRLALILATIAAVFFIGFIVRMVWFGH
ncbi:cytochrome oxidase small assembly protein [Ramlibacter tataouinensis]|nr:cytochrome oxidase small assembly protein [Ramlibacter tataouinensis]